MDVSTLTEELTPEQKYNAVYQSPDYARPGVSVGYRYAPWVCDRYRFRTVLDIGCGSGHALLKFLQLGKIVTGTEISKYLLEGRLKSLVEQNLVYEAYAHNLPFRDGEFDMVYSTEVLEHILEPDVPKALSEMWRVTNHYIFMSVCFRESKFMPILKLHETVKPAEWWEARFKEAGMSFKRLPGDARKDGAFYVAERV